MGHSHGLRSGTRYAFSRNFKEHGQIALSTYLKTYRVGDIVDIKVNGAVQKGMPYKVYNGKTGVVYNVTKSSVGVLLYKVVRNRYLEKRVNIRIEHVKHSRSREDFIKRVKENAEKKKQAKEQGVHLHLKRQPVGPREAHVVEAAAPETITPIPYDTHI
ncbi:Ribosomal protein L21e [Aspergillus parasiticus SU-1]|uniref:Ribosomal protein L21e-domain-containing protein n=4 Tax=Aspergillus subgen. Circumdati TaxID=2720871 RepID=A0A5N6D4H0_ASPPA|nr:ribosomal protein L21e-domain-containing protein [Aspergillus parasiticus]KAE8308678.1 ribosomal protein L21e-domain-containing protein [Aspergillus transmontanensis]KAE8328546.1 ribosomal protein L21e-domain-containing protein [Aspergillus sergii]KJK67876.1 Ribosomal protein L21e [Aspergillus parasiticus SU-1]